MLNPSTKAEQNARAPSARAYGGVVLLTVIATATILLTYTMLPLPGQRELGALNYFAAAFCFLLVPILLKRFRPGRVTAEDPRTKPRLRSRARRSRRPSAKR
jgi:hypothetical protein